VIRLGMRLARAGGPVRMASLFLGAALAVALLGVAWGLPDALYPRYEDPLTPGGWISPPQRGAAMAMSTLMLAPVLMLLIATGRLSAVVRDQRLIALRLIGVSKARTLVAAVAENVSVAIVGVVAGLGLLRLGAWAVDTLLPVEQPFHLNAWQLIVLSLGVVGLSGLLAVVSARTLQLLPTQARRGGVARQASWWRALPVVAALTCFGVIIATPADLTGDDRGRLFLAGVATGALGIATAPALVSRYSATLLRKSRRLSLTMAGRSIQTDPTSATRRVAAVGIGLFAIIITAGVMNAWESVPQSRYATHNAERGPQAVYVFPEWIEDGAPKPITEADLTALSAVPGAQHVVADYGLTATGCDWETWEGCFTPFVGTCAQLAAYMPITGCSDERAAWIDTTDKSLGGRHDELNHPQVLEFQGEWRDAQDNAHHTEAFTVHTSTPPIEVDWRHVHSSRGFLPETELFIPEHLIEGLELPLHSVDVIGPPGRDFATAVILTAQERGLHGSAWSYDDYDNLISIRTMLGAAGAALVAVIVLTVTLSILDWLRESRRPRMRLFAVGLPRGLIARTYLIQFGIPLLGAIALGGVLGGAGIRAYEIMGSDIENVGTFNLPPTYWWLSCTLIVGVLLAAALAGLAARERMRASDLRRE